MVIYEENHSFDNLYGGWGDVHGQHVDGLADATTATSTQVGQDGTPYACLPQVDVNLDLAASDQHLPRTRAHGITASHFANAPFSIDDYIHPRTPRARRPASSRQRRAQRHR